MKGIAIALSAVIVLMIAPLTQADLMSFEGLAGDPSFLLPLPYTESGLTLTVNPQPDVGPAVWEKSGPVHKVIHFDGGALSFDRDGQPFDLTAIDFDFAGAPETRIFVTTHAGFTATLPTTVSDSTYGFDTIPQFDSITSFTLTPEDQISCVEIGWVEFVPVPEPATREPGSTPSAAG
jgi:hypothetical protein